MTNIQTIGNSRFTPHCTIVTTLFFRFSIRSHCHTSNRVLHTCYRVNGTGKCKLNRSTNLPSIFTCRHHCTKCTYIIVFLAHHATRSFSFIPFILLFFNSWDVIGSINKVIQNSLFFHKNIKALSTSFCHLHVITYFTLQTNIRHQTHACFCINTWQITSIGISIRVTVSHIKKIHKINTIFQ